MTLYEITDGDLSQTTGTFSPLFSSPVPWDHEATGPRGHGAAMSPRRSPVFLERVRPLT